MTRSVNKSLFRIGPVRAAVVAAAASLGLRRTCRQMRLHVQPWKHAGHATVKVRRDTRGVKVWVWLGDGCHAAKLAELSRAALQQRRADHAFRKWREAHRKLKLAQTVEKRWRAKVRYYERVTGKKVKSELLVDILGAAEQAFGGEEVSP